MTLQLRISHSRNPHISNFSHICFIGACRPLSPPSPRLQYYMISIYCSLNHSLSTIHKITPPPAANEHRRRLREVPRAGPRRVRCRRSLSPIGRVLSHLYHQSLALTLSQDDSLVVVKEFNLGGKSDKIRSDALRESEVLKRLNHPNVIAYYDTYEDDGER